MRHTFEATEPRELSFERGDIRVVDRAYEAGWRGQLRGCTGTFPVNYVACISRRMKLVPLQMAVLTNMKTTTKNSSS